MKVRHFMKHSILILITCFCMLFPFTMHPKAATGGSGAISNNRGTYWWQFVKEGVYDLGTGYGFIKSSMHVEFNLSANYSGQITITINGTSNFSDVGILVKDGYISTSSSNQVKVQIVNTDHFSVDFYSSLSFTTVPSWTVSVSPGTLNVVPSSEETSLNNISATLNDSTFGLAAIHNDLDSVESALSVLHSDIQALLPYIDDVESYLIAIRNFQMFNFPVYQYSAIYYGFSYVVGTSYPDLVLYRGLPYFRILSSESDGIFTASKSFRLYGNESVDFYMISSFFPQASTMNIINETNNNISVSIEASHQNAQGWVSTIFRLENNSSSVSRVELEFLSNGYFIPVFLGNDNHLPDEVAQMFGIEYSNVYVRLLRGILNAVGSISQTTINESITNINNYNQYQTTINQIENNYIDYFNTYNTYLDDNSIFDFSTIDTNGIANFHTMFANFWNISLVRWPILIILLGLIILVILG